MGEVIDLTSQLAGLEDNQEFVADLCRFAEEILTEGQVRKKYRLAESSWSALGETQFAGRKDRGREGQKDQRRLLQARACSIAGREGTGDFERPDDRRHPKCPPPD